MRQAVVARFDADRTRRSADPEEPVMTSAIQTSSTSPAVDHTPGSAAAARAATTAIALGVVAEYVVTMLHPAHAAPNDHSAAFAEYASSRGWIPVHLGQFAAGLVIVAGFVALLRALRPTSRSPLTIRVAEAAAVLTTAVLAVLQGVDGIALKRAVDSLAAAPTGLHAAAFRDAETVRWVEESMAAYYRLTFGLTVVLIGVAVVSSRALPRWTAAFAVLAGLAFIADGIGVGYSGFAGATAPNLVSWASFAVFALATTIAAWRRQPQRTP
jgi:hypothetical protein